MSKVLAFYRSRELSLGSTPHALTDAERDVLSLAHLSNADIAAIRGVSKATVKVQIRSALAKLQASNRTEAALLLERRAA